MQTAYDTIRPLARRSSEVFRARIPGSKSYTNRALVLAAQRMGRTTITGALHSQDTLNLARALAQLDGLDVERTPTGFEVGRSREKLGAATAPLDVVAAGTPARLLLSFAIAVDGASIITGNPRLCERPMGHLLRSFDGMGIDYSCLDATDCLPVRVCGGPVRSDRWEIDGSVSSQFVTSLLLLAAQQERTTQVCVTNRLVSRPYVEMTVRMMRTCGLRVDHDDDMRELVVHPGRVRADAIAVETDASAMSYFLAAAALTQTAVHIAGVGHASAQGDVGLARAFEEMGCRVVVDHDSILLEGGELRGIDIDMERMPDVVLTLAVVASRARGVTRIRNIANLRVKECDRIHAAASELSRLGVQVEEGADYLIITGTSEALRPSFIETYDDHRVAMSFGLLRLLEPAIAIQHPECAAKSFGGFWDELARFIRHHEAGGLEEVR